MTHEAAAGAAPAPEGWPAARFAYPLAIAITLAALLLRGLLDPWLDGLRPTVTLYGAVAAAVWLGGAGPAVLSAALGFILAQWLYVEPRGSLGPWDAAHIAGLAAYLISCALIVGFGVALRRSRAQLVVERAQLQREVGMRREAELAARRSADADARLAALLRHSHDAIVGTSVDGLIEVWNPTAERLFGYRSDEVVGRPVSFYVPPERTAEQEALITRVLAGETVAVETQRLVKDGQRIDVLLRITPMRDAGGRIVGHAGSLQDIGARHRAAARLRESEAQARLALQVSLAGTWSWDADDDSLAADARCRELCGLDATAPLGLGQLVARIHVEDRARVEAAFASAMASVDAPPYLEEFRLVHDDGSEHWVVSRGQALSPDRADAAPARPQRLLGTLFDITGRKAAEVLLRDADRRKDAFLATLAHELRNPLAPISSGLQILRRVCHGVDAAARPLQIMQRQLGHMVRLIDDLLDISRISHDRLELRRERLELAQVVASAIETSRPLIDAARHALEVVVPETPLYVEGDATRLSQVLANLLNNAAKYTPPGGHIRLEVAAAGTAVGIAVQDDGAGIPAEVLSRIFDMFTQVDRSLERTQGGLGIGLAIATRLAALHGGSLSVSSEGAGRGSRFVLRLTLAAAAPAHAAAQPAHAAADEAAASRPPGPRRILIADDNADSADSLGELLRILGHETRIAHDGLEALEAAAAFHPDVALLDIGMPRLNGYEVARRLRAAPRGGALLLVAITGWGQDEDRRRSKDAGFDGHLVKPVELKALQALLGADATGG